MLKTLLTRYKDKVFHFVAGLLVGSFVLIAERFFAPPPVQVFWAIAFAALAGAAKEGLDHYENARAIDKGEPAMHDVSFWDFLATTAGGLFVAILYTVNNR
jgi:uncharacterized membrane protein